MGKQVKVPMWVADDGTQFTTEAEMLSHEAQVAYGPAIEAYLDHKWPDKDDRANRIARTRAKNVISDFLGFQDTQGEDETEEEK